MNIGQQREHPSVLRAENYDQLAKQYAAPLLEYLNGESEAALMSAYEFGRDAMAKGLGPLDIISIHQEALRPVIQHAITTMQAAWIIDRAKEFFVECISPLEMILRGYQEINVTLRTLNDTLERCIERTRELEIMVGNLSRRIETT